MGKVFGVDEYSEIGYEPKVLGGVTLTRKFLESESPKPSPSKCLCFIQSQRQLSTTLRLCKTAQSPQSLPWFKEMATDAIGYAITHATKKNQKAHNVEPLQPRKTIINMGQRYKNLKSFQPPLKYFRQLFCHEPNKSLKTDLVTRT